MDSGSPAQTPTPESQGQALGTLLCCGRGAVDAEPCLPVPPALLLCCVILAWLLHQGACSPWVVLINAIKGVAKALSDLIGATKELPASLPMTPPCTSSRGLPR